MAALELENRTRTLRILLVEDDPVDAMLIREQLKNAGGDGYRIDQVRHLGQAFDAVRADRFDIALLDLNLGDSSGLQTFREFHSAAPDLPVIVVTSLDDQEGIAELLALGAQDCLMKGTTLEHVLPRAIRYALERNRARARLKQSLQRVSESEARLRHLINVNADAVLIVDMAGTVRFANPAAEQMFGGARYPLVGATLGRPIGNGVPVELDIRRPDGSHGVAELRVARTEWDDEEVFLASLRDVTVRVNAEQQLRTSEQQLQRSQRHLDAAQQVAVLGSFEFDCETRYCACSAALRRLLDNPALGCLQLDDFVPECFAQDWHGPVRQIVESAARGENPDPLECRFLRNGGEQRIGLLRCEYFAPSDARSATVIGVIRDITELRRAQARHAEIEEQLRQAQKLEALGTLAGGIAHDLNNTLQPMLTIGSMLQERGAEDDVLQQGLDLILASANRAKTLVREVLDFSRRSGAKRQPLQLDELVRGAARVVCAGLPTSIECQFSLEPVPEIHANEGQIYQVLLNLVTNAAQAIGKEKAGRIEIGVGEVATGVALTVSDNGPGMSEDVRRRIFEPFFTTKAASEGTGLGLAVVQGIVSDHGAEIAIDSTPGAGTRFTVIFARTAEASERDG